MRTIADKLIGNGLLFRAHHRKGESVHSGGGVDARIIERVRKQAYEAGLSRNDINRHEMAGERGEFGYPGRPFDTKFIGLETLPNGVKLRSYNVEGDHPLAGSTVGVTTLVHNRIFPNEINRIQLAFEYLKEAIILGWYWFAMKVGL